MSDTTGFVTAPGPGHLDPTNGGARDAADVAGQSTGSPNEAVVEPIANENEPTGTLADWVSAADEFEGDPMAAAMQAILEQRGYQDATAPAPPEPDPTDPGPGGPAAPNEPDPAPAPPPNAPPSPPPDPPTPATPPAPPAPTPATPTFPDPETVPSAEVVQLPGVQFGDQVYTPEQIQHALELAAWNESLHPDQVVAINEYLAGRAHLAPLAPGATGPTSGGVGSPAPAGAPTSGAGTPSLPELDPDDPVAAHLAALTQTVQQTAAQQQALIEQQTRAQQAEIAQRRQAELTTQIATAATPFGEKYGLDEGQVQELLMVAGNMQIIPGLMRKHQGNAAAATSDALETAFWSTPAYRDAYVQSQAQLQLDADTANAAALDERRRKAASLGSRGAPPPRTAPEPQALTREQRTAAMVSEVAQHMQNGQG